MGQQDGPPAHLATACPIIGEQNKSTLRPPSLSVLLWDDPKVLTLTRHHRSTSCALTGKKCITRSINNISVGAGDGCLMRWLCRCLVIGGPFFFWVRFFIQWVLLLLVVVFFFFSFVPLSASLIHENWWGSFTVPMTDIRRALSSPCLLQLHPLFSSSNRIKMGLQVYQGKLHTSRKWTHLLGDVSLLCIVQP